MLIRNYVLFYTVKTAMYYLHATHVRVTQTYVHTPDVGLTQLILCTVDFTILENIVFRKIIP